MTEVRVLYGAGSPSQPLSYLLRIGDFTILLDCGWDDAYAVALLEPLLEVVDTVDAVLLSHPDPMHLGALPLLAGVAGRLPPGVPIYCTGPVHKMGQMYMYDAFLGRQATSDFSVFTLDDVDAAFARATALRYQQTLRLGGRGEGMAITPLAAGHLLGGTVWRVEGRSGEEYVYAVDWNHRKERVLNGTVLEAAFCRPTLLITDARGGGGGPPAPPPTVLNQQLLDAVMATLRGDGNVLIPIDAAGEGRGRILELILLLERHWAEHRLTYPLVFLSPMAYNTLEFAKSQLEWMNEALVKSYLKLCSSREELGRLPQGPKLVLATCPSLEAGLSCQLFAEWAGDPRNALVFVLPPPDGTLAATVLREAGSAAAAQQAQQAAGDGVPRVRVTLSRRVPLEGEELQEYLEEQRRQQEAREVEAEMAGGSGMEVDGGAAAAGELGPSSPRAAAAAVTRANSRAIGHLTRGAAGGGEVVAADGLPVATAQEAVDTAACLIEGFSVPQGAAAPMFPFEDEWEHETFDEYGASLDYADFDLSESYAFKALEGELEAEAAAEEAPAEAAAADLPTKVVSAEATVALRARVLRFDYSGLADERSVRTILAHVAPRHCVLVHGSAEATAELHAYLQQELADLQAVVEAPGCGDDGLLASARLHRLGDYELAWVAGTVAPPDEEGGLLQLIPEAAAADEALGEASGAYGGVFIGNVRLSELRRALAAAGIPSEFAGGALYCGGRVVVRRGGGGGGGGSGEGGLVVEGALGPEFYRVREVVYQQYHLA
eukprot:scaffold11.g3905.t1